MYTNLYIWKRKTYSKIIRIIVIVVCYGCNHCLLITKFFPFSFSLQWSFFCETKILHFSFTLLIRSFWFETKNERNFLRLVDDQIYTVPIKKSNVIPIQFIRFYSWNQKNKNQDLILWIQFTVTSFSYYQELKIE